MEARRTKRRDKNQTAVIFPNAITTSSTPFESGMRLNLSGSEHSLSPISLSHSSNVSQNSNVSHSSNASHTSTLSSINMQNQPKTKNPTTLDMICKAIEVLDSGKSGSSVPAIKKWIVDNCTDITESRLKVYLKKAFVKGLVDGTLVRPSKSRSMPGATGSFCLAKNYAKKNANGLKKKVKNLVTKPKKVSKEKPEDYVSDTEMTINKTRNKSMRRNMSDTELDVVRKSMIFEEMPRRGRKAGPSKKGAKENSGESASEQKKPKSKTTLMKNVKEKVTPAKPRRTRNIDSANKENTAPLKSKTVATKEAKAAKTKEAKAINTKEKAANAKDDKKQAPKRIQRKKT